MSWLITILFLMVSPSQAQDSTYAGLSGATVLDAGVMQVTSGSGFARTETFEYLQRPDGGVTLLNTMTSDDGRFRVRARFDHTADWQSIEAWGKGLYDGAAVDSHMERNGTQVDITVTGAETDITNTAVCEPDCFINMSPSATAMFLMTRHHSMEVGKVEQFRWAGQDLDRVRTLDGGKADLKYEGEVTAAGKTIRYFTFIERLPLPNGTMFDLPFQMWTDMDHWPLGFKVGSGERATVGFRKGWEDVRAQLLD